MTMIDTLYAKPFWRSKTLWANALMGGGVLSASTAGLTLDAATVGAIITLVNFVLRFFTTRPLTTASTGTP